MNILRLGSKGDDVKVLQAKLGLSADGIFGVKTDAAVRMYQVRNGLVADGIVGEKTWAALGLPEANASGTVASMDGNNISIVQKPLSVHLDTARGRQIKYLLIHYTAGSSSKKGSAAACYKVFQTRKASCDFAVDDVEIVQFNGDIKNKYSWECGDGNGKYGVTNTNSIGIEICSNLKSGYSGKYPNHEGWYFTDAALNNAVKLARYLMKMYNIPKERVIRHYDASRKACPGIIGWNTDNVHDDKTGKTIGKNTEEKWLAFKARL